VFKAILKNGLALLLIAAPGLAMAHAGHSDGVLHGAANMQQMLAAGFIHPFTGLDHLLMMLCVGIWAGRSTGSLRWQLSAGFLLGMTGGWVLGLLGATLPGLETGIAATLIALGVVLALRLDLPRSVQLAGVALGAALHGLAHGGELGGGAVWAGGIGMLAATALLHAAGFAVSRLAPKPESMLYRAVGGALALIGSALLATA
jgi:urease accessory protein